MPINYHLVEYHTKRMDGQFAVCVMMSMNLSDHSKLITRSCTGREMAVLSNF